MPKVVVRKGYRCLPGKRRELLAALQRVDAVAAEAGWPRGRYLFVETKAPGEPDLEVEFTFESYTEMEQRERRLREYLGRVTREAGSGGPAGGVGSAGQEYLLEPSAKRYLLLLDEASMAAPAAQPQPTPPQRAPVPARSPEQTRASPPPLSGRPDAATSAARQEGGAIGRTSPGPAAPPALTEPPELAGLPDEPMEPTEASLIEPSLTPVQRQAKQLAQARAALANAEQVVNLSARRSERRAIQEQQEEESLRPDP